MCFSEKCSVRCFGRSNAVSSKQHRLQEENRTNDCEKEATQDGCRRNSRDTVIDQTSSAISIHNHGEYIVDGGLANGVNGSQRRTEQLHDDNMSTGNTKPAPPTRHPRNGLGSGSSFQRQAQIKRRQLNANITSSQNQANLIWLGQRSAGGRQSLDLATP